MSTILKFEVMVSNQEDADKLIHALRDIGIDPINDDDEIVSLEDATAELFPDRTADEITGMILKDTREEKGLTQENLAKTLGTSRSAIALMESGKRPISKAMAKKLGKVFDIAYTAFL